MLKEYRLNYERVADVYLSDINWRSADKNVLFFKYCEYDKVDKKLSEAYLSALIVRYWHLISTYCSKSSGAYDAETVYEWLVHCIQYAKDHKPWEKGGKLEGQANGPDKAINIYMKSMRQGFYQWSNAAKRSVYFTQSTSLEKVMEDTGDAQLPYCDDVSSLIDFLDIKKMVQDDFKNKLYMGAFIIDGIINAPVIDTIIDKSNKDAPTVYTQFNKKKLSKHIRNMDDKYCKTFSEIYDIPEVDVLTARNECSELSSTRIYNYVKNTLAKLKKDMQISNT